MGQLVMSFRGIVCHVFEASGKLPDDVPHRVVAVNAARGLRKSFVGPLPPHHCFLEMGQAERKHFADARFHFDALKHVPLHGWNIRVENAAQTTPPVIALADVFPLKTIMPTMEIRPEIANDEDHTPEWAACFVDVPTGTVVSYKFVAGGGLYTTWTVETTDKPQLRFTPRSGKGPPVFVTIPSTPPDATLSDGVPGSLVLHNGTLDKTDAKGDFLLQFLLNQKGLPKRNELVGLLPGEKDFGRSGVAKHPILRNFATTTSCSNSTYP